MAQLGYARVSTVDQSLDLQCDALRQAGCERIFEDQASGARADRPGLTALMTFLRKGDTMVVWKLDRLGRSMNHLVETVKQLESCGVGFRSLTEGINTTTPGGVLVFHIFGALAQFERDLIRERTNAGLKAALARGRKGGRPSSVTAERVAKVEALVRDKHLTVAEAVKRVGISRAGYYAARPSGVT